MRGCTFHRVVGAFRRLARCRTRIMHAHVACRLGVCGGDRRSRVLAACTQSEPPVGIPDDMRNCYRPRYTTWHPFCYWVDGTSQHVTHLTHCIGSSRLSGLAVCSAKHPGHAITTHACNPGVLWRRQRRRARHGVPGPHLVACRALLCRAVRSSKVHRNGEGASREEGALVGGVQLDPREGGAAECEVEHSRVAGATVAGADARRARFRVPIRLHAWQP